MTVVLLVEDSATLRHLITQALQRRGMLVHAVDDGDEVIAAAQRLHPDVIVLNKMLPGRDGPSLLPELRSTPETREASVMMLTDADSREDVLDSIDRGADDYVIKPFDPADLAQRVERLAKRRVEAPSA